jgi:hypothetical protein
VLEFHIHNNYLKTDVSIAAFLCSFLLASSCMSKVYGQASAPSNLPVTNLLQLVQLINSTEHLVRDVQLEATVCAASEKAVGVVILQDSTDAELFEFSGGVPELLPGDKIRINRKNCWLRRREMGVQISASPIVDNNGIHARRTTQNGLWLRKGRHPLTLEWFNREHEAGLEVKWLIPGSQQYAEIPSTNLFCSVLDEGSAQKSIHPGLLVECYEGDWERVPNFDLFKPVKTAMVTNIDLNLRTRDEFVALRFRGLQMEVFYSSMTRPCQL